MYYEPDTVWGRTIEGDQEVKVPKNGLSLAQRRMLRELGQPRTFAALAAGHRLEPPKLEHELIRLAERRLVAFQRPGATQPRTAPRIELAAPSQVLLAPGPWKPPLVVYLLTVTLGCLGVLYFLT